MATKFLVTNVHRPSRRDSGNFPIPKALVCSGLLSATAWAAIAGLVVLLR